MKNTVILIISCLVFNTIALGQSLEDLRQLEEIRKQLEQSGSVPKPADKSLQAESLEVFEDDLSKTPDSLKDISAAAPETVRTPSEADGPFMNLPHFGMNIFRNARVDYTPEMYGPVDGEYPLGPGDEVIISVWGEVELRHSLIINREGQIFIPEVGQVNAAGLMLTDFREQLRRIMGKSYSSIIKDKAFLDVSLGKLRSVRIYVVGEVNNPGVFTVPALTSAFQMLFYAGGTRETGSLRDITLVRNDRILKKLDFYDFLTEGKKYATVRLQTNDVIHIPATARIVYLDGSVQKPAVYQMKEQETLTDLIAYSGGFTADAFRDHIQVERILGTGERKIFDVPFMKDGRPSGFTFQHGDRVFVESLDRELRNYVTVSGPIYGPNRFEFEPGMTITRLFAQVDSIRGDAYLERVEITREMKNRKQQVFSVNLRAILDGEEKDFELAPRDRVRIASINTLFPEDFVRIYGAVNEPGEYLLKKDMTLKDLIFEAGGFEEYALVNEAEISRIDPRNVSIDSMATLLYVKIDSNYTSRTGLPDEVFLLKPYDNVFIRENSDWELQRNVTIRGEVQFPGVYSLRHKQERLTDLIARAGGLKPTAYAAGATIFRDQNDVGQIGLDFERVLRKPDSDENIYLRNGDVITIPERRHTVKVIGGVHFPSSVLYEKGKSLSHYISSAGGFTELADKENVTIRLADGRVIKERDFLFWNYLPEGITAGSTIRIPVLAEREKIDWSGAIRDAAAILSSVATTILIIDRIK